MSYFVLFHFFFFPVKFIFVFITFCFFLYGWWIVYKVWLHDVVMLWWLESEKKRKKNRNDELTNKKKKKKEWHQINIDFLHRTHIVDVFMVYFLKKEEGRGEKKQRENEFGYIQKIKNKEENTKKKLKHRENQFLQLTFFLLFVLCVLCVCCLFFV